ncbi:cysteine proteinase [Leucogyrophana mollusca]|uniref:Cysteine proteinase n=1 Tax=Leucogyrophana mollusca TaxID=85980 RepID=A0ACB8BIJ4_9AGAM|nr:cysteine proteinase [Leucogyrophana mollusca]
MNPARLRSTNLPEVEAVNNPVPEPFLTGHPILPEDMDMADIPPSQLYEMNQNLLNESVPQRPLIDALAPMSALREEYENGSPSFVTQIDQLSRDGFNFIRRTRGDGDCFYRSVAYAFVDKLLHAPDVLMAVASALSNLESTMSLLDGAGFQRIVYEDFLETFTDLIQSIIKPDDVGRMLTDELLLHVFQTPELSNAIVVYLRLLTSAHIRADPDNFAPFLMHPEIGIPLEPREFCEHFVEAVGKEADHVQITALSQAMKINVNIAYLDGRKPSVDFVRFDNAADANAEPLILLYRPGHYDVLVRQG